MASHMDSTSSEEMSSHESIENKCNFYGSHVGEIPESSPDVELHPFQFEPQRIRPNVQPKTSGPQEESDTDHLGNRLVIFCFFTICTP